MTPVLRLYYTGAVILLGQLVWLSKRYSSAVREGGYNWYEPATTAPRTSLISHLSEVRTSRSKQHSLSVHWHVPNQEDDFSAQSST